MMPTRTLNLTGLLSMLLAMFTLATAPVGAWARELKTPELLQGAIASARAGADTFAQCARKADEEGFAGAASLFRAAARAQQVHERALTKALSGLNAAPDRRATPKTFEVKTTRENLTTAQAWLADRQTGSLRADIATARTEGQKAAEEAFNYTRQSFKEIAKFMRTVGGSLDDSRAGKVTYYVDRTCGYVVDELDFQKCPVCNSTRDNWEKVD